SRDTARRDLVQLQGQGAIIRTRGGGILPTVPDEVKDYSGRPGMVSEEKSMNGKAAASLIREGVRMIWVASTSVQSCAEHL
ncbi:DeoR family transcriptional regulator, partial [Bacillus sp. GbtcB13]|uniref:DeoR family transcriptional regulator n=1 Tax=Bacillus sp. GbtcB13 TaxID=2824758 RepID=UPI001C307F6F